MNSKRSLNIFLFCKKISAKKQWAELLQVDENTITLYNSTENCLNELNDSRPDMIIIDQQIPSGHKEGLALYRKLKANRFNQLTFLVSTKYKSIKYKIFPWKLNNFYKGLLDDELIEYMSYHLQRSRLSKLFQSRLQIA